MPIKTWQTALGLLALSAQLGLSLHAVSGAQSEDSDPSKLAIGSEIVVDRFPIGMVVSSDSLWILQPSTLLRVDLSSNQTEAEIAVKCSARALSVIAENILVACEHNKVFLIDPSTNTVAHTLRAKGVVSALTRGDGRVWILHPLGMISSLDPENPTEVIRLKIPGKRMSMNQNGLAYLEGKLWILNSKKSRLMGVNADSGEVTQTTIEVGKGVTRIVAAAGSLWIIDTQANEVSRFDPDTGRIVARIPVGDSPTDAVLFEDAIWVVNAREHSLTRIELESNATTTRPIPTAALPVQIFEGDGSLWLTTLDMFRVIRLQEPASDARLATGQGGPSPTLQCLTGPEYQKEMLERECDSARAIQGGPAGRLATMAATGDGGWAFAGTTSDSDPALLLIHTDQEGKVLREQRIGVGAESRAVDVVRLDDDSLAVAGDIRTDKESPWETLVGRVDANSNSIWEKRYPAAGASRLVSQIAALPSGELAMSGSLLSSASSSQRHGFVARIDVDGEMVWETELKEIEGVDQFATSGTEFAVVGPPQGQASLQFLRVDFAGNLIGSVKAASENMQATDLVAMAEGGWAVVGDPGEWAGKGHLLRLDPQGELLWCRYLGSANAYKWVWKLVPLDDGSLLAAATPRHSQSFSGAKGFLNIARISAEGEFLGEQLFKGFAGRQVVGLFPWSDGFVVFTAGDWRGPLGQKLVRAYERPKRRYSGSLKAATRVLLDPEGQVLEEAP